VFSHHNRLSPSSNLTASYKLLPDPPASWSLRPHVLVALLTSLATSLPRVSTLPRRLQRHLGDRPPQKEKAFVGNQGNFGVLSRSADTLVAPPTPSTDPVSLVACLGGIRSAQPCDCQLPSRFQASEGRTSVDHFGRRRAGEASSALVLPGFRIRLTFSSRRPSAAADYGGWQQPSQSTASVAHGRCRRLLWRLPFPDSDGGRDQDASQSPCAEECSGGECEVAFFGPQTFLPVLAGFSGEKKGIIRLQQAALCTFIKLAASDGDKAGDGRVSADLLGI
jgi:hypothetical protein